MMAVSKHFNSSSFKLEDSNQNILKDKKSFLRVDSKNGQI